jgi:lipopolysaccharide transport system ATP-binding protein
MGLIIIKNLGKAYKKFPNNLGRFVRLLGFSSNLNCETVWVLRGINLTVQPGEAVGVLGINGAGKSTLLKIIAGVASPTVGSINITGKISAILELGTGFHPDFTGRQNIVMAAQIQGLNESQISKLIPEIESFAGIGNYIDQPTRIYSTGMSMRLAFSVATCMRPDVLIIDEAMAVGDAAFQHRCIARIKKYNELGTTLFFVSHSTDAIKSICSRAILIDGGTIVVEGSPNKVVDFYNASIAKKNIEYELRQVELVEGECQTRSGTFEVKIDSVKLESRGEDTRTIIIGDPMKIIVNFTCITPVDDLSVGLLIKNKMGIDVFGTNTFHCGIQIQKDCGDTGSVFFDFPSVNLGVGSYTISIALHSGANHIAANYDWMDRAITFQVLRGQQNYSIGICNIPLGVEVH